MRLWIVLGMLLSMTNWGLTQDTSSPTSEGLSAEQIAEIPVVEFERLPANQRLIHDRWYKRVKTGVHVYDAPNGQVVRYLDEGFNFVTVSMEIDGWSQINPNEWIETQYLSDASPSSFTGFFLPEVMPQYTVAWALINLYPSPEPGANPRESLGLIYRYTPLRIYAQKELNGVRWYQIGAEQWIHQHHVAKIQPLTQQPEGLTTERWIGIDLYEQVLIAYEGMKPIFATLVSSGLPRWPTNEGLFHIYYRQTREFMSWGQVGDDFYALEEVPWTMFFDEGRALHGAYWHDGFGYRRSHGCVNMSITDAHWLYQWVAEVMGSRQSGRIEQGPMVYVYSSGVYQ
ncbi:MAG: L,D-transpeptidase [Anaerolineae bacterium]|nr:L,D-transpeptidase [Anaerolineae bacterium]